MLAQPDGGDLAGVAVAHQAQGADGAGAACGVNGDGQLPALAASADCQARGAGAAVQLRRDGRLQRAAPALADRQAVRAGDVQALAVLLQGLQLALGVVDAACGAAIGRGGGQARGIVIAESHLLAAGAGDGLQLALFVVAPAGGALAAAMGRVGRGLIGSGLAGCVPLEAVAHASGVTHAGRLHMRRATHSPPLAAGYR